MQRFQLKSPTKGLWAHSDGSPIEHPEQDARGILAGLQLLYPEDRWALHPASTEPTVDDMIRWFDQLVVHARSRPATSVVLSPIDFDDLNQAAKERPNIIDTHDACFAYRGTTILYVNSKQAPGTLRITFGTTTLDATAHSPWHLHREGLQWK